MVGELGMVKHYLHWYLCCLTQYTMWVLNHLSIISRIYMFIFSTAAIILMYTIIIQY